MVNTYYVFTIYLHICILNTMYNIHFLLHIYTFIIMNKFLTKCVFVHKNNIKSFLAIRLGVCYTISVRGGKPPYRTLITEYRKGWLLEVFTHTKTEWRVRLCLLKQTVDKVCKTSLKNVLLSVTVKECKTDIYICYKMYPIYYYGHICD